MARALDRIPSLSMGRPAFYMNRTVHSMLRIQAMNKTATCSPRKRASTSSATRQLDLFDGVPLRKVDQLLNTEARVV
jgi:hypothetical protein